jgi:alpha-amylase
MRTTRQFSRPNSPRSRSLPGAVSLAILFLAWHTQPTFGQRDDDWQDRIIYFALLDRFENGNPENDKAHGDPECNNAQDAHAYQGGDLAGLKQRMDAIAKLGANAIWVTPLYKGVPQKVGDNCGFPGYWAAFSDPYEFELDPRFGTAEEFDEVLTEAHARDIKVILDMVVNHAGYDAPLVEQRPEWFHDPRTSLKLGSPEIFACLAGLPDFNHRHPEAAEYLLDLHTQWVERFKFDGIRMDTVKHVEPWYFRYWINGIKTSRPDLFIFGEILDESYAGYGQYLDAGFAGLFNFPLRRSLIDTFAKGGSVDVTASRVQEMISLFGQRQSRLMVTLLDNHDVPRFMEEFPAEMSPETVHERYKLALTALLTLPGIPQLTYGNEVGMYGGADPDNRRMMPDWAFEPGFDEPDHSGFVHRPGAVWAHLQRLIELRSQLPSLARGDYEEIWRQSDAKSPNVWVFVRKTEKPEAGAVLVVLNNGDKQSGLLRLPLRGHFTDGQTLRSIPLEFDAKTGRLDESTKAYEVRDGAIQVELKERSALVLEPEPVLP